MEWMTLPLKRYADFSGRSRRMEFWMFQLGQWIVYFLLAMVLAMFGGLEAMNNPTGTTPSDGFSAMAGIIILLFVVIVLGLFIPNLAVMVRRLHDQNLTGWLVLIQLIPLGGLVLLVFMFIDGNRFTNNYGPDPKAGPETSAGVFQ